jgi:transposase
VLDASGHVVREQRIATRAERFATVVPPLLPARVLLEASTESGWVATALEQLGAEVIVANPRYAPMYATRSRRVKTDKRDARALADAALRGTYVATHRVSAAQRTVRELLTARAALVRNRTRLILVVRALLRSQGLRVPSGTSATFGDRVRAVPVPPDLARVVTPLLALIPHHAAQIARLDRQLAGCAHAEPVVARLRSVCGIGPLTALAFVATLDTADRFTSGEEVAAYCGLVPTERSSGERQRRGPITKAGNVHLRALLVEAAWTHWRSRSEATAPLRAWTDAIAARRGKRIAVVALARRLARLLWVLWRDGTMYDPARVRGRA